MYHSSKNVVTNPNHKIRILEAAKKADCDYEGDIVVVDGKKYFVDIFKEYVEFIERES